MLISLTYMSRPTAHLDEAALEDLLAYARRRNHASGVSGVLLYSGKSFLQTIEGPAEAIEETYKRIRQDPRHFDISELWREEIDERLFGEWTMGYRSSREDELQGFVPLTAHASGVRGLKGRPGSRCLAFHRAFQSIDG